MTDRHAALIKARDALRVDLLRLREATEACERKLAVLEATIRARRASA